MRRPLSPGESERRGHHVLQVDRLIAAFAHGHLWADHQKGHPHAVVVLILLAEQAVVADGETVVGGEEDPGVVGLAARFQGREDATDLGVHVLDQRVVLAPMHRDRGLNAGIGRQPLIAQVDVGGHDRLVGILGKERGRQRQA